MGEFRFGVFRLPCLASFVVVFRSPPEYSRDERAEMATKTMPDSSRQFRSDAPPTYGHEGIRECLVVERTVRNPTPAHD